MKGDKNEKRKREICSPQHKKGNIMHYANVKNAYLLWKIFIADRRTRSIVFNSKVF